MLVDGDGKSKAYKMTAAMWSMWIWNKYGKDADIGPSDVEVMLNLWDVVRAARIYGGRQDDACGHAAQSDDEKQEPRYERFSGFATLRVNTDGKR